MVVSIHSKAKGQTYSCRNAKIITSLQENRKSIRKLEAIGREPFTMRLNSLYIEKWLQE